jgi:hypothetical protein
MKDLPGKKVVFILIGLLLIAAICMFSGLFYYIRHHSPP